ncbi:MAG: hypothetical protein UT91_C0017G0012 [Parcubacteria group bacterium GW2011_GWA2_40_23]|nr:MAG: hypothetical protein UT91_C0017G0012 [Parcubacteria group bacterium GW2011_GWA2_40_23]
MYEDAVNPDLYSSAVTVNGVGTGGLMAILGFMWLIVLVLYVYQALCWLYIAKRTNTPNGWFAFIPILNIIIMLQIAKRPLWWIILYFIPIVNIVIAIMILVDVVKVLKRPTWWVIMQFIPIVNLVFMGLMAWGKTGTSNSNPTVIPPTATA